MELNLKELLGVSCLRGEKNSSNLGSISAKKMMFGILFTGLKVLSYLLSYFY